MAELTTLARPYARAAFQYALDAGELAAWAEQLATLAVVSQHQNVVKVITSPGLSVEEKTQVLADLFGDELSAPVRRYLSLLTHNNRLALLPEIYRLFGELKAAQEKTVNVELTTALPLDEATQQQLAKSLTSKLARKVNLQAKVDQRLLAGVVVKAGDLVIDGSVRGRLDKLAQAINS